MACSSSLTSTSRTSPNLPAELKLRIFEIAARGNRGSALQLALVANHVKTWIEPIIYETVSLYRDNYGQPSKTIHHFLRTLDSKPSSFFARHVKTLILTCHVRASDATRILSACTGVSSLACWTIPDKPLPWNNPDDTISSLLPFLQTHKPVWFSVNTRSLMGPVLDPDFNIPLFHNVTHLELVNQETPLTQSSGLHRLPLTHLAFNNWDEGVVARTLQFILSDCKTLRVVVATVELSKLHLDLMEINDVRFVMTTNTYDPISDWEATSYRNSNMWDDAEQIIAIRRKKRPGSDAREYIGMAP